MRSARTLSIAIVESDDQVGQALGSSLRAAGMTTVIYPSLEIFRAAALPESFDCVVLAARLAGRPEFDLREVAGKSVAPPPILFLTSEDQPSALARALAAGGYGCFCKSGCGEETVEAIRNAVRDAKIS